MAYITSDQMRMMSVGLGFLSSYSQAQSAKAMGKIKARFSAIESDRLLQNATLRMNQGMREGQFEAYKGRVAISDTTANMVAGGSELDPVILAKLKARADSNTMAAVFDAQVDASSYRQQAITARAEGAYAVAAGKFKANDIMLSAASTALTNWPTTGNPDKPFDPDAKTQRRTVKTRAGKGVVTRRYRVAGEDEGFNLSPIGRSRRTAWGQL